MFNEQSVAGVQSTNVIHFAVYIKHLISIYLSNYQPCCLFVSVKIVYGQRY